VREGGLELCSPSLKDRLSPSCRVGRQQSVMFLLLLEYSHIVLIRGKAPEVGWWMGGRAASPLQGRAVGRRIYNTSSPENNDGTKTVISVRAGGAFAN